MGNCIKIKKVVKTKTKAQNYQTIEENGLVDVPLDSEDDDN